MCVLLAFEVKLSSTRDWGQGQRQAGRQASQEQRQRYAQFLGTILDWLDERVTLPYYSVFPQYMCSLLQYFQPEMHAYVCTHVYVNADFMTVERLKLEGLCILMWFQRLNVIPSICALRRLRTTTP